MYISCMGTLGSRARATRLSRNMTQRELAERSRTTINTVSSIERDRVAPSAEILARLSAVLGVSLDWLMRGDPALVA